jgi:RHS repeat-associated protein
MRDHGSGEDFFYLQDDLFSVYAITDEDGVVVERYDYGDYGQVSIMAGDGTARAESQYDNRHAFTGRLLVPGLTLDDGSQILEYRHRYMHTASGRFVQRDPLGVTEDINLYNYTTSNPTAFTDPLGQYRCSPYYHPYLYPLPQITCDARCIVQSGCPHELSTGYEASQFAISAARRCAAPNPPRDGTRCNAVLHCVWNCVMQCRMGPNSGCPKKIGDCHEKCNRTPQSRYPWRDMDLINNRIGRTLGKRCPSSNKASAESYCENVCMSTGLMDRPDYRLAPIPFP